MRKDFYPFQLERDMSIWEYQVKYNLSESGVQPLSINELAKDQPDFIEDLISTGLHYPQTNGLIELREKIAGMYPSCTKDNVVVTTGAAQANFTSLLTVLDPGDEIVVMLPNYMQIYGFAKNYGLKVKTYSLVEGLGWSIDPEELEDVVTENTRLIAVCNPNNPTGHILSDKEMETIVNTADRVGAWILADEVYAGAEHHQGSITPSFWGRYKKVLAIGSLSKAYAMPGLRIGWVASPGDMADEIWARQDYITISTTMLANKLATYALSPDVRDRITARTRQYVRKGFGNFVEWCNQHKDMFSYVAPQAAAIVFVRYERTINSTELVRRLINEQDTYVVPGDHFGLDQHLRISYGLPKDYVNEGLNRIYREIEAA